MEENWGIYMTTLENMPASIVVNLHVEDAQRQAYPHCHFIRIELQTADESGLPEESELTSLHTLLESFLFTEHVLFVGTVTTNGIRDFILYTAQKEEDVLYEQLRHVVEDAGYDISYGFVDDESHWGFYDHILYPNIYEKQYMTNDEMTDYLHDLGDDGSIPRTITHTIIFERLEALQKFEAAAISHGFAVLDLIEDPAMNAYTLAIERVDTLDLEAIDTLTYFLINLAEQHEGLYDGWETEVVSVDHE